MGMSASRSFGPISGSSSIIEKTRSMTSLNSLGESKEAPMGYWPEVVPPAPAEVAPPAEVVPPPEDSEPPDEASGFRSAGLREARLAGFVAPDVRPVAWGLRGADAAAPGADDDVPLVDAGLRAAGARPAGDDPPLVEAGVPAAGEDAGLRAARPADEDVVPAEAAGLRAAELARPAAEGVRLVEAGVRAGEAPDARRVDAGLRAAGVDGAGLPAAEVERVEPVAPDRVAVAERRVGGCLPRDRVDADGPPGGWSSSAETRLARPSTSPRRPLSSPSRRSSSTSRMRLAAALTSLALPRVDLAPSAEAEKVRSMAARTASTASAAPASALPFFPLFFESFLAMAARS